MSDRLVTKEYPVGTVYNRKDGSSRQKQKDGTWKRYEASTKMLKAVSLPEIPQKLKKARSAHEWVDDLNALIEDRFVARILD